MSGEAEKGDHRDPAMHERKVQKLPYGPGKNVPNMPPETLHNVLAEQANVLDMRRSWLR